MPSLPLGNSRLSHTEVPPRQWMANSQYQENKNLLTFARRSVFYGECLVLETFDSPSNQGEAMRVKLHLIAIAMGIAAALLTTPAESLRAQQAPKRLLTECTATLDDRSNLDTIIMDEEAESFGLFGGSDYEVFYDCSSGDTSNCGICMYFDLSFLGDCFVPGNGTVKASLQQPAGTPSCNGTWRTSGMVLVKRMRYFSYYKLRFFVAPKPCPPFNPSTWEQIGSQILHTYGIGVQPPC